MSTHNICFCGEIRKISIFRMKKNALSIAMLSTLGKILDNILKDFS